MNTDSQSGRYFRASFCVALVTVVLLVLWSASDVLLLAFSGVLFAVILRELADLVGRHTGLNAGWALAIVLFGGAAVLTSSILLIGPTVTSQLAQLQDDLPAAWSHTQASLREHSWGRDLLKYTPDSHAILSQGTHIWTKLLGAASTAVAVVADLVVIGFLGLYFAVDPDLYRRGILALVPTSGEQLGRQVLDRLHDQLRHWLVGKLALMLFVGVFTALGLWILHMPLIITLALLAALLDFIPNVGPIISAVPAALLALTQGPKEILWVLALYFSVQIVESYILQPIVQQRAVSLPPSVTLVAQILIATVLGPLGLILATPLTVVVMTLIQTLYVQHYLNKPTQV